MFSDFDDKQLVIILLWLVFLVLLLVWGVIFFVSCGCFGE